MFVVMPLGFGLIRYITFEYAPYAAGSGIPQTMAAVRIRDIALQTRGLLSPLQSVLKVLLVCLGLACGASIGREGPSIQIGAAAMVYWAYRLAGRARVSAESLVIAGGAGGLAAAFNTPLAGIVFAMEELARGRTMRSSWFVLMSILGAGFLSLAFQGNYEFFPIYMHTESVAGFVSLFALSAVCGLFAGFMAWLLLHGLPSLLPKSVNARQAAIVAAGIGLALALLALMTEGASLGTGYQVGSELLNADPMLMPGYDGFSLIKILATVLSYAAGIPGGIFTPSLSIGAGLGHDFSVIFHLIDAHQFLVLVGMVAFLAGVVQAPVTATVIVMEMTKSQNNFLHLMLAAVVASLTAKLLARQSIYEVLARQLLADLLPATTGQSEREPDQKD